MFGRHRRMEAKLDLVLQILKRMESTAMLDFTKLIAAAQKQQNVTNSVLQFITDTKTALANVQQQLADAIASNDPAAQKAAQDQLDAIVQGLDDNDQKLADAIAQPGQGGGDPSQPSDAVSS